MNEKEIKVLLIEDNPGDARLIREMLAKANGVTFDLECKDHLSTGLKRINTGGIDVVLLDLSLPDSQGLDTFIDLHAHTPESPIVVLSGLDDEEVAVKAVQEGAQDYLVKGRVDSNLLVRSIRYSIERKRAEEELIRSEKLAGIGTLAAGIAHEINNPLAGITGYAEIILDQDDPELMRSYAKRIMHQAQRAADIVKWLSRYSKEAKDCNITDVDLHEVIDESLEALKHTRISYDVEIAKNYRGIPKIKGNRSELQQVFVNLMNNAVDAMEKGGRLTFTTINEDGFILVKVSDNGGGIPEENIYKIYDPFFTTKAVGEGTGLGLYVCSMIMKKHHGTIEVESEVGKGTTFSMRFPISEVGT